MIFDGLDEFEGSPPRAKLSAALRDGSIDAAVWGCYLLSPNDSIKATRHAYPPLRS